VKSESAEILLQDAINRDRTTARRAALVEIFLQERYLTREHLIVRVEGKLGKGCFGASAWKDIFFRDMQLVKQALQAEGYILAYSRSSLRPGYYLRDRAGISSKLETILDSCVSEVDPSQIRILKKLTFKQRFQQGCSVSNLARTIVANRIRQRNPRLSSAEAQRLSLQGRNAS
jgi:hypothetical protein